MQNIATQTLRKSDRVGRLHGVWFGLVVLLITMMGCQSGLDLSGNLGQLDVALSEGEVVGFNGGQILRVGLLVTSRRPELAISRLGVAVDSGSEQAVTSSVPGISQFFNTTLSDFPACLREGQRPEGACVGTYERPSANSVRIYIYMYAPVNWSSLLLSLQLTDGEHQSNVLELPLRRSGDWLSVDLSSPLQVFRGTAPFEIILRGDPSRSADVTMEFSTDKGKSFQNATAVGGNFTGLQVQSGGYTHQRGWDTLADNLDVDDGVILRAIARNGTDVATDSITIDVHNAVDVQIVAHNPAASGDVTVEAAYYNPSTRPVDIVTHFRLPNGSWQPATLTPTSVTNNLPANSSGIRHSVVWRSAVDIPGAQVDGVEFRIIATDSITTGSDVTHYDIDNQVANRVPDTALVRNPPIFHPTNFPVDIPLTYERSDPDGTPSAVPVTIKFEFSTDAGQSWALASTSIGNNLSRTATNVAQQESFTWYASQDVPPHRQAIFRVEIKDAFNAIDRDQEPFSGMQVVEPLANQTFTHTYLFTPRIRLYTPFRRTPPGGPPWRVHQVYAIINNGSPINLVVSGQQTNLLGSILGEDHQFGIDLTTILGHDIYQIFICIILQKEGGSEQVAGGVTFTVDNRETFTAALVSPPTSGSGTISFTASVSHNPQASVNCYLGYDVGGNGVYTTSSYTNIPNPITATSSGTTFNFMWESDAEAALQTFAGSLDIRFGCTDGTTWSNDDHTIYLDNSGGGSGPGLDPTNTALLE